MKVHDSNLIAVDTLSGERRLIQAQQLVLALGAQPQDSLLETLAGKSREVYAIGDCSGSQTILEAVRDGFLLGHRILENYGNHRKEFRDYMNRGNFAAPKGLTLRKEISA